MEGSDMKMTKETSKNRNHSFGDSLLLNTRWRVRNNRGEEDRREEEAEFRQ